MENDEIRFDINACSREMSNTGGAYMHPMFLIMHGLRWLTRAHCARGSEISDVPVVSNERAHIAAVIYVHRLRSSLQTPVRSGDGAAGDPAAPGLPAAFSPGAANVE